MSKLNNNTLTYTKQYQDAPFSLQVQLTLNEDWLQWRIDATKQSTSTPDISLRIHFLTPLIAGWDIWAPPSR